MAQNQLFSTVTNEDLEDYENDASNTTINFEKKNDELVDEFITNNNTAEQSMNAKTTDEDKQPNFIDSSEINATSEILSDQNDDISVRNVEVAEILENDDKDPTTIDQTATKEVTPIDDVQLILLDNDEDLLPVDKQYDFIKTEEIKLSPDNDKDIDNPHDSIKYEEKVSPDDKENIDSQHDFIKTERRVSYDDENFDSPDSVKTDEQLSLDNDEDVESSTPSTPQGDENILATISKVAPELSQVLNTWNSELNRHKVSKDLSDVLDKDPDTDKLLQDEITHVKDDVINDGEKHDVKDKGEDLASDIQSSSSERIKNISNKDSDLDKLLQGEIIYVKDNDIYEEDVKDEDKGEEFMSDIQGSPSKRIRNITDKDPGSDKLLQDEITRIRKDTIEEEENPNVKVEENFVSDIQGSPSKRIKIEANSNEKYDINVSQVQTLLQPTSSAPTSIVSDVVESMFVPGFNRNVVLAIDLVFLMLLIVEGVLAVMTNYNVYVLVHMGITLVLFIALQLFLAEAYRAQIEEVSLITKKEE
ncbi:5674_t:CDS:2 [Dentiscutata erythropus]|uniref:5674_t:CDS:1 n=1 Tax=Dentiscutata erythropus TaxID=1348616 RepID=A0A9N8YTZ7_9GLOM|nr:5674_t:CDS:2 [Dentiscutata erythropus]